MLSAARISFAAAGRVFEEILIELCSGDAYEYFLHAMAPPDSSHAKNLRDV